MPYIESETKAKIRQIMNSAEPVLDGITHKLAYYEVKNEHFQWLLKQAEKLEKIEKAWRNGSGEDIDVELQEAFE